MVPIDRRNICKDARPCSLSTFIQLCKATYIQYNFWLEQVYNIKSRELYRRISFNDSTPNFISNILRFKFLYLYQSN